MIEKNSIERLRNLIDITDVIGNYITLQRSGGDFVGICPFHDDTKPSLRVSANKGLYHCFACGAGGDAIKFIMEYEKLSYPEAIEKLANMYNFELTYTSEPNKPRINKKILENLNIYYKSLLYKNKAAMDYLKSRAINNAMIERFELGWAANSQNTLNFLQNEGILASEAEEVGAIKRNENGVYASFIDRITFPIYDHLGRLVGFGGRTISDHPAKYVNSPQSEIFDKSRVFYGLDKAKDMVIKTGEIIICEGYMDCIMLHQTGFNNAVAVLGTALTTKHLPLLKRNQIKVILSLDSDVAGQNAAFKSAKLLAQNEIDGRVILISGGKDPAEMVANGQINELRDIYKGGTEIGEFYLRRLISQMPHSTPIEISHTLEAVREFTYSLKPVVASVYEPLVAELLNIDVAQTKLFKGGNSNYGVNSDIRRSFVNSNSNSAINSGEKKDILELSTLKNAMENTRFLQILKSDELCSKYAKDVFFNHFDVFIEVINSANEPITRLKMDDTLEIYADEAQFSSALNNLKIAFCDRIIAKISASNSSNKDELMLNWQKVKLALKKVK